MSASNQLIITFRCICLGPEPTRLQAGIGLLKTQQLPILRSCEEILAFGSSIVQFTSTQHSAGVAAKHQEMFQHRSPCTAQSDLKEAQLIFLAPRKASNLAKCLACSWQSRLPSWQVPETVWLHKPSLTPQQHSPQNTLHLSFEPRKQPEHQHRFDRSISSLNRPFLFGNKFSHQIFFLQMLGCS